MGSTRSLTGGQAGSLGHLFGTLPSYDHHRPPGLWKGGTPIVGTTPSVSVNGTSWWCFEAHLSAATEEVLVSALRTSVRAAQPLQPSWRRDIALMSTSDGPSGIKLLFVERAYVLSLK